MGIRKGTITGLGDDILGSLSPRTEKKKVDTPRVTRIYRPHRPSRKKSRFASARVRENRPRFPSSESAAKAANGKRRPHSQRSLKTLRSGSRTKRITA